MPGTFAVAGTSRLPARGLMAYGNVVSGDVCAGELLVIPLNRTTAMSAVIRAVEAVDGSHVGLLLGEEESDADLLDALDLEGETFTVSSADVDVYAGRTGFDEAKHRLLDLLARSGWPQEIAWIDESHVVSLPHRVFIYLPGGRFEPEQTAREQYESAAKKYPAVRLGAVGIARGLTIAAAWPVRGLAQGERMFIEHGLRVDVPAAQPAVTVTSSRLRWWLIRRGYRKWVERRDAALRTG